MSITPTINGKEYIFFILQDKVGKYTMSAEPFVVSKNDDIYTFQMLRDLSFNGICKRGDVLNFEIVAIERTNSGSIRQQMFQILDIVNNSIRSHIKICEVSCELDNDKDYQPIDNGKVTISLEKLDNGKYMYMHPHINLKKSFVEGKL